MNKLQQEIQDVNNQLKDVRKQIRRLKVTEDGLANKLDRLLTISVNQTEINFEDGQERNTTGSDGERVNQNDGSNSTETL